MKLISMTDFVLEIEKNSYTQTEKYRIIEWQNKCEGFDKIIKYANFLKQPLKLEMFVPCDENGNVLDEKLVENYENDFGLYSDFEKYNKEYNKAKEKVLFEEFKYLLSSCEFITIGIEKKIYLNWNIKDKVFMFFSGYNIEELNKIYNLTLTPNAIKQFQL